MILAKILISGQMDDVIRLMLLLVSGAFLSGCATTHPSDNYGGGSVYRGGKNDSKEYYDSVYMDAYPPPPGS